MKQWKIDILILIETHISTNSTEQIDEYTFVFFTAVKDETRAEADVIRENTPCIGKGKGRGKGKVGGKSCI